MGISINLRDGCETHDPLDSYFLSYLEQNRQDAESVKGHPFQTLYRLAGLNDKILDGLPPGHIIDCGASQGGRFDPQTLDRGSHTSVCVDFDSDALTRHGDECGVTFDFRTLPEAVSHLSLREAIEVSMRQARQPIRKQLELFMEFLDNRPVSAVLLVHILGYLPPEVALRVVRMALKSVQVGGKVVLGNGYYDRLSEPLRPMADIEQSGEFSKQLGTEFTVEAMNVAPFMSRDTHAELESLIPSPLLFKRRTIELMESGAIQFTLCDEQLLPDVLTQKVLQLADESVVWVYGAERMRILTRVA